jgi:hypothetical protein
MPAISPSSATRLCEFEQKHTHQTNPIGCKKTRFCQIDQWRTRIRVDLLCRRVDFDKGRRSPPPPILRGERWRWGGEEPTAWVRQTKP